MGSSVRPNVANGGSPRPWVQRESELWDARQVGSPPVVLSGCATGVSGLLEEAIPCG